MNQFKKLWIIEKKIDLYDKFIIKDLLVGTGSAKYAAFLQIDIVRNHKFDM